MEDLSHTAHIVTATVMLLLIAAGTLAFTKRFKWPFTVTLVLVGMVITFLVRAYPEYFGMLGMLEISHDLIIFIFLPTLIFESTFNMDVQRLRKNLGAALMLAVPGLLLSTAIIGGIVSLVTDLPLTAALVLGAILSATDPVAVIAMFKQLGAPKRLVVLVEGESLLNDATAIVLTKILLGVLVAGSFSGQVIGSGIVDFIVLFLGGVFLGVVLGWIASLLLGMVESDALIEISITTAAAYLSFLLAEEVFHVSGIMATVGAGLVIGGWGRIKISSPVRVYLEHFWEYMAFLANAFIFLLVGMKVSLPDLWQSLDVLGVVIVAMLLARAVVVYGLVPILNRLPDADPINFKYQTVMLWGGLRGAIALAIVLSLKDFAHSSLFTAVVIGAVLFTLLVQGFSMKSLMRRLGLDQPPLMDVMARMEYRLSAQRKALELIPQLRRGEQFSESIIENIQHEISENIASAQQEISKFRQEMIEPESEQALLFLRTFAEERACYAELFARGHINEQSYRQLLLTLSTQTEALRHKGKYVSIQTHRLRRKLEPYLHAFLKRHARLAILNARWYLRRLTINYENDWAHYQGANQVLEHLHELGTLESASPIVVRQVEIHYQEWRRRARKQLDATALQHPEFISLMQERLARRMVLITAVTKAGSYAERGILPHAVAEHIQEDLRLQIKALRGIAVNQMQMGPAELLRKIPLFQNLSEAALEHIALNMQTRTFEAREKVVHQDTAGDRLYLIARGVLRVYQKHGRETTDIATLIAGDHYGEGALLDSMRNTANVISVTPSTVYVLRRKSLENCMQAHSEIHFGQCTLDQGMPDN